MTCKQHLRTGIKNRANPIDAKSNIIQCNLVNTNTVNTNFRIKSRNLKGSIGVRMNEVLLHVVRKYFTVPTIIK